LVFYECLKYHKNTPASALVGYFGVVVSHASLLEHSQDCTLKIMSFRSYLNTKDKCMSFTFLILRQHLLLSFQTVTPAARFLSIVHYV